MSTIYTQKEVKERFKVDNKEIELDIEPGNCDECYYYRICCTLLKNPINPDDKGTDFQEFCLEYIDDDNDEEVIPTKGTLEENLPYIFPDVILDKIKENKEIKDTINNYCEFFCSFECIPECPFFEEI